MITPVLTASRYDANACLTAVKPVLFGHYFVSASAALKLHPLGSTWRIGSWRFGRPFLGADVFSWLS